MVGFTSNLLFYLVYLGMTRVDIEYRIATTLLNVIGVLMAFIFNWRWTSTIAGLQWRLLPDIARFEIVRSTSFGSLLLPAMAAARLKSRNQATYAILQRRINRYLNGQFRRIIAVEFQLIRRGANFALGGSRLLVARKTRE